MTKPKASRTVFWITIGFLFLPLLVLALLSFNESKSFNFTGFSLRWYESLFSGSSKSMELWVAVKNSFLIALTSAGIATIVGTLGAIGLNWYRFWYKPYVQSVSFIPLVLPEVIIGVSLLILFTKILGIQPSMVTLVLAHASFELPFVMLLVQARLSEFDMSIIEAGRDLGAREHQILLKIIVPLAVPGILSGFLTAFTLSLEDFVVTQFVKGANSDTLPLYIFSEARKDFPLEIAAFSVLMILFTIGLVFSIKNLLKYVVKANK